MSYNDGLFFVSRARRYNDIILGEIMVCTVRSMVEGTQNILDGLDGCRVVEIMDAYEAGRPVLIEYLVELDCLTATGELDRDVANSCRYEIVQALKAESATITDLESTFSVLHKFQGD